MFNVYNDYKSEKKYTSKGKSRSPHAPTPPPFHHRLKNVNWGIFMVTHLFMTTIVKLTFYIIGYVKLYMVTIVKLTLYGNTSVFNS